MTTLPELLISKKEFDNLFEYSLSLPTALPLGKTWKRRHQGAWIVGRVSKSSSIETIVNWFVPVFTEELDNRPEKTYLGGDRWTPEED